MPAAAGRLHRTRSTRCHARHHRGRPAHSSRSGPKSESRIAAVACTNRATMPRTSAITEKTQFMHRGGRRREMKLREPTGRRQPRGRVLHSAVARTAGRAHVRAEVPGDPARWRVGCGEKSRRSNRSFPCSRCNRCLYWTDRSRQSSLACVALAGVRLRGVVPVCDRHLRRARLSRDAADEEIGIRVALGSSAAAVFRLVLREGVLLVAAGFIVGGNGSFLFRRTLESQSFGVAATNPAVLIVSARCLPLSRSRVRGARASRHQNRSGDRIDGIANRLPLTVYGPSVK